MSWYNKVMTWLSGLLAILFNIALLYNFRGDIVVGLFSCIAIDAFIFLMTYLILD